MSRFAKECHVKIDLSGKKAVVTGSTQGIGLAIAKGLVEAGALVTINGRNRDKLEAALGELGSNAKGVVADLATVEGCASLVAAEPQIDIVISNLGISKHGDILEAGDDIWELHWQTNVMAGVRLARAYLPGMQSAGWGRFILIASETAINIPAEMIHYGVSKAAVLALARGIAKRMAGTDVTANSVLVGPTLTESVRAMVTEKFQQPGQPFEEAMTGALMRWRPSTLLRRPSTPEEIANMVVYLASPLSSATTGAAVRVDGGVIETV